MIVSIPTIPRVVPLLDSIHCLLLVFLGVSVGVGVAVGFGVGFGVGVGVGVGVGLVWIQFVIGKFIPITEIRSSSSNWSIL